MKTTMRKAQGPICRDKQVLLYLCILLLAESIEPNPGPRQTKFPCAICSKACKWTTPCVCCDSCDVWYHQECMGMPDSVFKALTNITWECVQCGVPNFSTGIFDTTLFDTSNSYSALSDITHTDSEISFSRPNATSSPHRHQQSSSKSPTAARDNNGLRTLVYNCRPIKSPGTMAILQNMIEAN